MKKRLLLVGIAMLSVVSSFAYNVGDYIYTRNGRFKVTGANLITNGDFKEGLKDWMKADLTEFDEGQTWYSIKEAEGPDGMPCIEVAEANSKNFQDNWVNNQASMAASTNLFRYVPVEANQNYVVTYKVRMSNETLQATAICPYNGRSTNYQAFYFKPKTTLVDEVETPTDPATFYNVPGSKETISNASEVANGEWQELSYSYSPTEDGYICMFFGNLVANECFGDFGVYPASEVSDDRGVKDALAQVEFYIANKDVLPNEQETLEGIKEMLEGYLANESKDEVNGFLQGLNTNNDETDPFKFFLDANTVDLAQDKYVKNFYNGGTSWTATGGNWGTASAKGNFNTQYVNQYMKQPGKNSTALAVGDYYQTFDLPAGKYLFVVQAQAYKFIADGSGGSSNYEIPRYDHVNGLRAFVGNDSINMDDVPSDRGKIYMKILDVEAGVKNIGFHSPGGDVLGMGGDHRFDGLQIRYIGTQADLDAYVWKAKVIEKLDLFQQGIDAAQAVYDSEDYIFEKTQFGASIAWAKEQHSTLTAYTEDNYNELVLAHDSIDKARRAYVAINKEYTQLKKDVVLAASKITEDRPEAVETLNGVIAEANSYIAAQTETSRDSLALVENSAKVLKAGEDYLIANARYATPADMFYSLRNNTFQNGFTAWEDNSGTGSRDWRTQANERFTEGYCVYYNRGDGQNDHRYIFQYVPITKTGVYEFEAECAVHRGASTGINDTDTWLYVGNDSIMVSTSGVNKSQTLGDVAKFKVRTVINEIPENGVLRVGLDRKGTIKLGIVYMGSTHVYYSGDYATYLADSMGVALQPAKDSLLKEVAAAQALLDEARNPKNVDTTPFSSAIGTARNIAQSTTSTFQQVDEQFGALAQAKETFVFSGVYPAKGKFYDHTKLLKNITFDDAEKPFDNWVCDSIADEVKVADSFNNLAGTPGYLWSFHRSAAGMSRSANIHQDVTGLLEGTYAFAANAVYRYAWREEWIASEYEAENTWFKMVTNTDTVALRGFMAEGAQLVDETNTKSNLVYPNGATISVYSTRHHGDANGAPAMIALFNSGLFLTQCPVDVAADGKATVGLLVENCPDNSAVMAYNLGLRFYGDREGYNEFVTTGVESVPTVERVNNGAIYNLRGQRVENPVRGLYIVNGKKYLVK